MSLNIKITEYTINHSLKMGNFPHGPFGNTSNEETFLLTVLKRNTKKMFPQYKVIFAKCSHLQPHSKLLSVSKRLICL